MIDNRTVIRFKGHDKLHAKYMPQIPKSAEREYARLASDYMKVTKAVLESELPKIKEIYSREYKTAVEELQTDSKDDLMLVVNEIFERMQNALSKKSETMGLRKRLENLANLTRKLTVKEWKKAIKATLGIDIREDYYLGDFYKEALERWVEDNVNLISTIPQETLGKMKSIIEEGYVKGKSTARMVKQIQSAYGISKRHASLVARDQVAKLNGNIQRAQQQDAGIEEYKWYTCGDGRVRSSHRRLNGKVFKWSDPPMTDGGRRCHPGEDYQCRCIARPVFNRNMNLPLKDDSIKVTYK